MHSGLPVEQTDAERISSASDVGTNRTVSERALIQVMVLRKVDCCFLEAWFLSPPWNIPWLVDEATERGDRQTGESTVEDERMMINCSTNLSHEFLSSPTNSMVAHRMLQLKQSVQWNAL